MTRKHPLSDNPKWAFDQYTLSVSSHYRLVGAERNVKPTERKVTGSSTCREGIIGTLRGALSSQLCRRVKDPVFQWDYHYEKVFGMDLEHPSLKQPDKTQLTIPLWALAGYASCRRGDPDQKTVYNFIHFTDATVGLLNVLLNPDRYQGNWWTSDEENEIASLRMRKNRRIHYFGVDNTILYHPALVSLYTGLLRQNALIAAAGKVREALKRVERSQVRRALTQSDPELAWSLFQKMRPWVEVPRPRGAYTENMPIAFGSWAKIPALHKTLYAYGFEEAFQGKPEASWTIDEDDVYARGACTGVYEYLGPKGASKDAKRIKALAQRTVRAEGGWRKRQTRKT